jgi:hypothetical protein
MMTDVNTVAAPAASIVARRVGDETILVNAQGDMLHTLNPTGTFIWDRLDGARSVGAILELLRSEYDLPDAGVEEDLCRFMDELAGKGIVTLRP